MSTDAPSPRRLFAEEADALLPAAGAPADTSPLARQYRILRRVLDGTSAAVAVLDQRLRYLYINPAMARMSGTPAEAYLGRTMAEVLPDIDRPEETLRAVLRDGHARELAFTGRTLAPSEFEHRQWRAVYHRLEDDDGILGVCGIGLEVSSVRKYVDDLERAHQRLALLDTAATRIGTTLDPRTTCAELADFLVPAFADVAGVEVVPQDDGPRRMPPPLPGVLRLCRMALAAVPELEERAQVFGAVGDYVDYESGSATQRCVATGRPWMANLLSDEALRNWAPSADRVAAYRAAGIHSALVVPMPAREHPVGAVRMLRAGHSPAFTRDDLVVAQELAARAAVNLDNARRYTREHTMALELQRALLSEPGSPHPDVEIASRYLPAGSSALVGGDWFDSIALPGGRTLLVMADVMGHGFEASVAMSNYRSLLRGVASFDLPLDQILARADHRIATIGFDRVATCLLVLLDPARATFSVASAGHLPPLLLHPGGRTELLPVPTGPPLGTDMCAYEMATGPSRPGTVLLLYTDGLVEQRKVDIDISLQRLTELRLPVNAALEDVLDTVLERLVTAPAADDVAVLAARLRPR